MFENKSGILLIAGLGFFLFAFLSNAVVPILMYRELPELTAAELVNQNVLYQFEDLSVRYPASFQEHYGEPTAENCAEALKLGRKIYVGEGCWHCHSQFVRPVSNESRRWGPVSASHEYQNELQRPVMFGTRRVGPDLSREGGRRGNDWHAVHFFKPNSVSPDSPMPEYSWFFDGLSVAELLKELEQLDPELYAKLEEEHGDQLGEKEDAVLTALKENHPDLYAEHRVSPAKPNKRGIAIITYVQWLGSWLKDYPDYEDYVPLERMMESPLEPGRVGL